MGKNKGEINDCDIDSDNFTVSKIGNGSYGNTYLIDYKEKKYIFKFTLSLYNENTNYKGKSLKLKKPGKCEYKIIKSLKDIEEIPKVCYFKKNVEVKDKYIKNF